MLTSWELIENLLKTHWEQEENEKSLLAMSVEKSHITFVLKVKGVLTTIVLFVNYCLHY